MHFIMENSEKIYLSPGTYTVYTIKLPCAIKINNYDFNFKYLSERIIITKSAVWRTLH